MGPDEVSGQILKDCNNELIEPIYDIITYSVTTGKVPLQWKGANITPIFKGGGKEEPLNYRLVSLTCAVCKICESIMKKQWVKHLERNNMINRRQFGFRNGRSCVTNLLCY